MVRVLMNTVSPDDNNNSTTWRSVCRALPLLLLMGIGAGAITFGILTRTQAQYTSEAKIQVADSTTGGTRDAFSDRSHARIERKTINAHVRAIMSADLAAKVIEQERLADKLKFDDALDFSALVYRIQSAMGMFGPLSTEPQQTGILDAYYQRLNVHPAEKGGGISIGFTAPDPQIAANVSNRLAEEYIASLSRQMISEKTRLQEDVQRKIAVVAREVAEAEVAAQRFRGLVAIFSSSSDNTIGNTKHLDELRQELAKAQAVRTAAAANIEDARELVVVGSWDTLPEVQKSPLIQNLLQQQARVEKRTSELTATLLPQHPRMRQLRAELKGLERQTTREIKKILAGIEKKAKIAARRVDVLRNRLNMAESQVGGSGDHSVSARHYERIAESKRAELKRLENQLAASGPRNDSQIIPINAAITGPALPATISSMPKKLPNSALVAIVVLLIGLALVATKAKLSAKRAAARARKEESARVELAEDNAGPFPINVDNIRGPLAGVSEVPLTFDTIPGLADQLRVRAPAAGGFRTLLTCMTDELDPANEAIELVKELTVSGAEVMLLDWCLDGSGVASKIGAPSKPGMTDVLQGQAKFDDVVVRVPGTGVHLIPCGGVAESTATLLDPDQVNLALDALDSAYDHIVVVSKHAAARVLFEAIEGRFDAGVMVTEGRRAGVFPDPPGTLLGFEVVDIALFRLERTIAPQLVQERIARFTGRDGVEARAS